MQAYTGDLYRKSTTDEELEGEKDKEMISVQE